jgi:hypothetical protein
VDDGVEWRSIDQLAALVGAYCWLDERIFALTGTWASTPQGDSAGEAPGGGGAGEPGGQAIDEDGVTPALRVWCAAVSRRHGDLATRWAARLPVRAGVDAASFVRAPSDALGDAVAALDGAGAAAGARAVLDGVLRALQRIYGAHLRGGDAVREGPVLEVVVQAHRVVADEIRGGAALVAGLTEDPPSAAVLVQRIERAFVTADVFPAVRPS